MIGRARACSSCGGILLGRRTRFCASCAPKRSNSDPRYGSRQWKRTVLAVKRRDGWRCQHCGASERLVVDHKTPHDRYPGSFFDQSNPWTLCQADNNSKRDLTVGEWRAALARRSPTQAPHRWATGPQHLQHRRTATVIDPQDAALVPRHVRVEALHEAEQAVGRVLERHGIYRDLFGRFELLDLALDEAGAEINKELAEPPKH